MIIKDTRIVLEPNDIVLMVEPLHDMVYHAIADYRTTHGKAPTEITIPISATWFGIPVRGTKVIEEEHLIMMRRPL